MIRLASRALALSAALVAGATLGGCRERTQIMLGLLTDLRAPDILDTVQIDVAREGVPILSEVRAIPGRPAQKYVLPGSYALFSEDGSEPRVEVNLTGFKGGQQVVTRRALLSLVSQKTLFYRMALVAGCMNKTDCATDETCVEGLCRPVLVDTRTLPAYTDGLEGIITCDSGTKYLSTETNTALPIQDSGCGGPCQEGTCYVKPPDDGGVPPDDLAQPPADLAQPSLWAFEELPAIAAGRRIAAVTTVPGSPPEAWAVGDNGMILHRTYFSGPGAVTAWTDESIPGETNTLRAIAVTPGMVWVAGDNAYYTRMRADTVFGAAILQGPTKYRINAIYPETTTELITAVGADLSSGNPVGMLAQISGGTALAPLTINTGAELTGVTRLDGATLVSVGLGGRVMALTNGQSIERPDLVGGIKTDLYAITSDGLGTLLMVGQAGKIFRMRAGEVVATLEPSPVPNDLFAVVTAPFHTQEFAVGDGVLLVSNRDPKGVVSWSPEVPPPGLPAMRGVGMTTDGTMLRVVAAGDNGVAISTLRPLMSPIQPPQDMGTSDAGDGGPDMDASTCNVGYAASPCSQACDCQGPLQCLPNGTAPSECCATKPTASRNAMPCLTDCDCGPNEYCGSGICSLG